MNTRHHVVSCMPYSWHANAIRSLCVGLLATKLPVYSHTLFSHRIYTLLLHACLRLLDSASTRSGGRRRGGSKRRPIVNKADISQPCCFTHVTRLERGSSRNAVDVSLSQRTAAAPVGGNSAAAVERTQRIFSSQRS